jgi:DNA gyrase subunit A
VTDTPDTPDEPTEDDTTTPSEPFELHVGGNVEPVGLEVEMQRSYLDYAMSVIVGRALPLRDVRLRVPAGPRVREVLPGRR